MRAHPACSPAAPRGFALLVTIVLVAFLVLILVGLATFTRVETQVATNSQQTAQARQNALTGLNIALGELQRFAGPDQRATARADIQQTSSTPPNAGARMWTGVWAPANNPAGSSAILDGPESGYTSNPTPLLLNWLVSGNESVSSATIDTNTTNGLGWVTSSAASPPARPSLSVVGLTISVTASTSLTFNGRPAALLVGPGTTGTTSTATYVVAPWVNFSVPENTLPGFDPASSTERAIGRHAWWIGDEGVKARLVTPDPDYSSPQGQPAWIARASASPRAWIGAMSGLGPFPADPAASPELASTLAYEQARLSLPAIPAATWRDRYHDITPHSAGVLSDSHRGGLREDLSYHRAFPPVGTVELLPPALFSPTVPNAGGVLASENPTLQKIISYLNFDRELPPLAARPASATAHGLFPVVVSTINYYAVTRHPVTSTAILNYFPLIVLANPYNVAIGGDYQFRFNYNNATNLQVFYNPARPLSYSIDLRLIAGNPLRITGALLQPGEARIYSLSTVGPGLDANTLSYPFVPPGSLPANTPFVLENEYNPGISIAIDTGLPVATGDDIRHQIANGGGSMSFLIETHSGARLQRFQNHGYGSLSGGVRSPLTATTTIDAAETRGIRTRFRSAVDTERDVRIFADYNWRRAEVRQSPTASAGNFSTNPVCRTDTKVNNAANSTSSHVAPLPSDTTRAFWGSGYSSATGRDTLVLYHVPRIDAPLVSVGQLAHADIGLDSDIAAYALGGGLASPYVPRDRSFTANGNNRDGSYLLNTAILDRFLLSGVPATGPFDPAAHAFASPRFALLPAADGSAPDADDLRPASPAVGTVGARAFARHALVRGAFNANSTSVEAWRAQLSALRSLAYNGGAQNAPFPRTPFQPGPGGAPAEIDAAAWTGFRDLADAEIDALATRIVARIRAREAPSLTVAQFANRRLTADTDAAGLRGIIQGAIDEADDGNSSTNGLNAATFPSQVTTTNPGENTLYPGGAAHAAGPVNAGIPGWLGQHDILSLLAPSLQTRSDTFVIRVAGESFDPVNSTPTVPVVAGRAWLEAVVQRLPDYVDPNDDPTESLDTLSATNLAAGRRFHVVSFRWLNPEDL